jgi:H+/Cl- antiporter ClcA
VVSTSLGFFGGEFIPLVFAGVHYGSALFATYGFGAQMGAVFGAFVFFAGGTRFKWTSIVLLLGLIGIEWWFWSYFVMATAVLFSGDKSLYKNYIQSV